MMIVGSRFAVNITDNDSRMIHICKSLEDRLCAINERRVLGVAKIQIIVAPAHDYERRSRPNGGSVYGTMGDDQT